MKYNFLFLIALIILSGCSVQKKLSLKLYQVQKQECGDCQYLKGFQINRIEANLFNVCDLKNDTLYIIESYDNNLEKGVVRYVGTYWSNRGIYNSYDRTDNNELIRHNHEMFNKYIIHLVDLWDINRIKLESEKYAVLNPFKVFATRIIFNDSNPQIESICFDYFWNIKSEEEFYK